jgi:hypothetical protein
MLNLVVCEVTARLYKLNICVNNTLPVTDVLELSYTGLSVFPISLCQLQHTELRSSGMWRSVSRWSVASVSKWRSGLIFRGQVSTDIYWAFRTLKMRPLSCLETLGTDHPETRCHIPEERMPQLHRCESLKIHKRNLSSNLRSQLQITLLLHFITVNCTN